MKTFILALFFGTILALSAAAQGPEGTYSWSGTWDGSPRSLVLKLQSGATVWEASLSSSEQDGMDMQPVAVSVLLVDETDQQVQLDIQGEVYEGTFGETAEGFRLILTGPRGTMAFQR